MIAVTVAVTAGCGSSATDEAGASAQPVSEEQAIAVLNELVEAAPGRSGAAFCKKFAYQSKSCEQVWREAAADCLKPAGEPRVRRSAAVRDTLSSDGGRVLEVEGRTAAGQRYVSEVFVTAPNGTPQASVGVYWSGSGLADSPFGQGHKVVPKSECNG
jgi:hypothetical protein